MVDNKNVTHWSDNTDRGNRLNRGNRVPVLFCPT